MSLLLEAAAVICMTAFHNASMFPCHWNMTLQCVPAETGSFNASALRDPAQRKLHSAVFRSQGWLFRAACRKRKSWAQDPSSWASSSL